MKNNILSYIIICTLSIFASCDCGVHDNERGVAVTINMPSDAVVDDIDIRVFDGDDILISCYNFATMAELGSTLLPIFSGEFTLVATMDANKYFTISETIGESTLGELLFSMNHPFSSPKHSHYGVADITVVDGPYTRVAVDASRVFAELGISIKNVPSEMKEVEMVVKNTASGFYPAVHKLATGCNSTTLGAICEVDNKVLFPSVALMPSVSIDSEGRSNANIKTYIDFIVHYENGTKVPMSLSLPKMENGGTYNTELDFELFRADIIVDITQIAGWGDGQESDGEILNPI